MNGKFDIEKYLDSLPDDVEKIDVSFRHLNYLPNLSRFKNLSDLCCGDNKLSSLPVLPENLGILCCPNNNLTSLPVLPDNLNGLECSHNELTSLPVLPKNLTELYCRNNNLRSLPFLPENLQILYCDRNKLTSLPVLSKNLIYLYCYNNNLTSFPILPENLKELSYFKNPIYELISNNFNPILYIYLTYQISYKGSFNEINKNIIILNNFRHLYYCIKYRKRFLKMMEPIIKKRYHPSYLYNLGEDDDLDEKLGAW